MIGLNATDYVILVSIIVLTASSLIGLGVMVGIYAF